MLQANFLESGIFLKIDISQTLSGCSVLAVMSWPFCRLLSFWWPVRPTCPDWIFLAVLSRTLVRLSFHSCPATDVYRPRCPVLDIMFWPSCPLFPALAVLCRLFSLAILWSTDLPICHFPAVLSQPSCASTLVPSSPVATVLSLLSCHGPSVLMCMNILLHPSLVWLEPGDAPKGFGPSPSSFHSSHMIPIHICCSYTDGQRQGLAIHPLSRNGT